MDLIALIASPFVLLGIFAVVCHFYFESENLKWKEYFHQLAKSTGLEIQRNEKNFFPNLVGAYFGHPTKLEILTVDGCEGVLPSIYARITIRIKNPPNYSLEIERKNILSRDRIKIGDLSFEEIYVISSQPEGFARKILASNRLRKRLIEAHFNHLSIKEEELSVCIQGLDKRHNDLSCCLEVLRDIANLFRNDSLVIAMKSERA